MKISGAVLVSRDAKPPFGRSQPIRIETLELDPPGKNELLVRIEAAGLCHSDLSVVNGSRPRPLPMLLGHEAAGIVEEIGVEVLDVRVGDRVVLTFLPRCGLCVGCKSEGIRPCIPGSAANAAGELIGGGRRLHLGKSAVNHHLGISGFATHAVVDRSSAVVVQHAVPPELAALLGCAVLTGGGAVLNAGRPLAGSKIAVVGLGGVGMAAVLVANALPDVSVMVIDTLPEKLAAVSDLDGVRAYTPSQAKEAEVGADVVIEAAGNVRALETAIAHTNPGGRTVTVGLPSVTDRVSFSPAALVGDGRSIVGSYLGSAVASRDIPLYVDMWLNGQLPLERLISSHIALDEINHGMDELASGIATRQIIRFHP
jgi:alcohol dehydrogenase